MKIVLGISGSIAAYKSYDLARKLTKNGHEVRVVLTQGAMEFIKPETFSYLGVEKTYSPQDDFDPEKLGRNQTVLHIELAKWADKLVLAPLSANTLGRLALSLNNDLLVSLFIAFGNKPVLLFPAMNTTMLQQSKVQENLKELSSLPYIGLINPISGQLACGDIGNGKFPDVNAVCDLVECYNPQLKVDKKIIITAGATAAPIDPVRYLTNPSTGRMGIAVAKSFLAQGYRVIVLAGHNCSDEINNLLGHPNFELIRTPTTEKMKIAALNYFPSADLYISTGAIADIEFDVSAEKIKKESMSNCLSFHQAADILKEILKIKKPHQRVISFAAETQTTEAIFKEKIQRKPVDLMIGNKVSSGLIGEDKLQGFQVIEGNYYFVTMKEITGPISLTKEDLGRKLTDWFEGRVSW